MAFSIELSDVNGITNFSLSTIANGSPDGFKILGEDETNPALGVDERGSQAGASLAFAGDINGDGFDDLIIGAPQGHSGAGVRRTANYIDIDNTGTAYVIFGKPGGFDTIDLDDVEAGLVDGFRITGAFGWVNHEGSEDAQALGIAVAGAGDINADGFDDIIVGGPGRRGAAYVIYGKDGGFTNILVQELGGVNGDGFAIGGELLVRGFYSNDYTGDLTGRAVATAGDINGDGFDDILVGAPDNDFPGRDYLYAGEHYARNVHGAAYVIFGAPDTLSNFGLRTIAYGSDLGFKIVGESSADHAGSALASVGDINGDGLDDIIVGATGNDAGGTDAGAAYVLFGKTSGFGNLLLESVTAADGFKIIGEAAGDGAGSAVASAGDFNGDGLLDIIISAPGNDEGGTNVGAAYVVFGTSGGYGTIDLDDVAAGTGAGVKIIGATGAVASAGDINDDGFDDVIVGGSGGAYLVFGRNGGPGTINLADIAAGSGDGLYFVGETSGDGAGFSVAGGVDLNHDGHPDILIGAPNNGNSGAAYVVFGAGSEPQKGTNGNDNLAGESGNDTILGLGGDDTLAGGQGRDSIKGGAGDDSLVGNQNADTLRGGKGDDLIVGNDGADRLIGGAGDDTMTGGNGADRFIFRAEQTTDGVIEHDIITDYDPAKDKIELKPGVTVEDHDILGGNLALTLTGGDLVELQGITNFADVVFV